MQVYTAAEAKLKRAEIESRIARGQIFIHPTDTIYGIGCNALQSKIVQKIRELKQRPETPFSIMAPSIEWIKENCVVSKKTEKYIKELPGPVTLILKTKKQCVAPEVSPNSDTVGVRIPDHWFHDIIQELEVPIITTSANLVGKAFMTSLDNLDPEIQKGIDFIIYEGEKQGRPSKIINLTGEKPTIKER
ncbi:threonylcarbamoyl-AMP synthase [Candidatus Woesearchaeota archaeon]|nr:threonylcarbamoyl-AMP synthase [Candidatus Woesearchaeota archaeon]